MSVRLTFLFALSSLLLFPHTSLAAPTPFRVVIDPGHGGADEGTVFDNGTVRIAEKEVTLALARETARLLKKFGFDVVLTRQTDKELHLASRTALANKLKADVFLSIHMNSTATPMVTDAEGIETFILNNASDASSKRLARLENTVVGTTATDSPEQMDVALILKDLRLDGNLSESKRLACGIQKSLIHAPSRLKHRNVPRLKNRGVKQALFHVLLGADMPSVLVEAGFLTSPRDRSLVLDPRGRTAIAGAITRAVVQYRKQKDTPQAQWELSRCKVN